MNAHPFLIAHKRSANQDFSAKKIQINYPRKGYLNHSNIDRNKASMHEISLILIGMRLGTNDL